LGTRAGLTWLTLVPLWTAQCPESMRGANCTSVAFFLRNSSRHLSVGLLS